MSDQSEAKSDYEKLNSHITKHLSAVAGLGPGDIEDYYREILVGTVDVKALTKTAVERAGNNMVALRTSDVHQVMASVWLEGFAMAVSLLKRIE